MLTRVRDGALPIPANCSTKSVGGQLCSSSGEGLIPRRVPSAASSLPDGTKDGYTKTRPLLVDAQLMLACPTRRVVSKNESCCSWNWQVIPSQVTPHVTRPIPNWQHFKAVKESMAESLIYLLTYLLACSPALISTRVFPHFASSRLNGNILKLVNELWRGPANFQPSIRPISSSGRFYRLKRLSQSVNQSVHPSQRNFLSVNAISFQSTQFPFSQRNLLTCSLSSLSSQPLPLHSLSLYSHPLSLFTASLYSQPLSLFIASLSLNSLFLYSQPLSLFTASPSLSIQSNVADCSLVNSPFTASHSIHSLSLFTASL